MKVADGVYKVCNANCDKTQKALYEGENQSRAADLDFESQLHL